MSDLHALLSKLNPTFRSPEGKAEPDVEIDVGNATVIFGRVVERKNFQLRPHLEQTDAYSSLRQRDTLKEQIPIVFARQPGSERWYSFLSVEDLVDLLYNGDEGS